MTTANESKLGGARGGHRGPISLRVAAARAVPRSPRQPGGPFGTQRGPAARCVSARGSSSPLRGGHCPPLAASTASAMRRRVARRKHPTRRRFRTGSRPSPSAPPSSAGAPRAATAPAPALPPPHPLAARILHLHVSRILNSNRSSSRFDQFQLPMTSFVCSIHWPPNMFATCARRSLRSHATAGYNGLLPCHSASSSSPYSSSDSTYAVCVCPHPILLRT